jgi:hypothetical protein
MCAMCAPPIETASEGALPLHVQVVEEGVNLGDQGSAVVEVGTQEFREAHHCRNRRQPCFADEA